MLPVTHGAEFTRLHVLLYTLVLFAATLLPFVAGMSGPIYLAAAIVLGVDVQRLRAGASGAATPTRWRARPSASRSSTCRCCSRRCWSTTTCGRCCDACRAAPSRSALAAARCSPAATVSPARPQRRRSTSPTSPAPTSRASSSCPTPTASRARSPTSRARSRSCSSATPSAPTSARRRWPSWRRSRSCSAPTATSCRRVFVTDRPGARHARVLKAYVANFGPGFVALRGNAEQTAAAAKEFKVFYAKVPGKTPGSYTMDHSAASFVFDPKGRVRLYVPYGGDPKTVAADIKQLAAA